MKWNYITNFGKMIVQNATLYDHETNKFSNFGDMSLMPLIVQSTPWIETYGLQESWKYHFVDHRQTGDYLPCDCLSIAQATEHFSRL
jgi:hypothetical protein